MINTENVNTSIIEALIQDIDGTIVQINTDLSEKHLEVLLENQKIDMNEDNLLTFNQQYSIYLIDFITTNISDYIDILDEIDEEDYETLFSEELVYQLLNSSAIQNSNKIMLIQKFGGDLKLSKLAKVDKEVRDEIARSTFDVTDMDNLVRLYEDLNMKSEVQSLMVEYFEYIDFDEVRISSSFISDSIANEDLGLQEKTTLILIGIKNGATVVEIKSWLAAIPQMKDIYSAFDGKRPLLDDDGYQYEIALKLEERGMISLNEDRNGYRPYLLKKGRQG